VGPVLNGGLFQLPIIRIARHQFIAQTVFGRIAVVENGLIGVLAHHKCQPMPTTWR